MSARPQHAQERRNVKLPKFPKMTALLETAPLVALAGISFGGSCGNILNFFSACGITGVIQYGDTACPDLLCLVAAREILRDRRIKRRRKYGWVSWPIVVMLVGIAMTLALGYIGADKKMLTHVATSWVGHGSGLLPGAVLLLALSILHRRDAGTAEGSSIKKATRKQAAGGTASTALSGTEGVAPVPAAASSVSQPVPVTEPAANTAEPGERTFEDLLREARAYRDELAAAGERLSKEKLRLRLTVGSGKALELLRVLKEDEDPSATAEASGTAVGE